jgi:heme-degrading monooxygenase HmoA
MHVTLRWYAGANALADAMSAKAAEVEQILRGVPGFISYYAVRDGDNVTTVTVCQDKTGTDESTRRATAWVKENLKQGAVAAPRISEGDTFISFSK